MRKIKEHDVFRFVYRRKNPEDKHDYTWCFDGQLIARKNQKGEIYLEDTYWSMNNRIFTPKEARAYGTLTFRFNLNDVKQIPQSGTKYYCQKDLFNFSHQHGCYPRFMLKNGAKKNQRCMLESINAEIEHAKRELEFAQDHLGILAETKWQIKKGNLNVYF